MEVLAKQILDYIQDYRNEDNIQLTVSHILSWAAQFGADAAFMLAELNHLIPKTYLSKESAKKYLHQHLQQLMRDHQYTQLNTFLADTHFLDMQAAGKSQKQLLLLLDEILQTQYGVSYHHYGDYPKKIFVYLDDILATGNTIGWHLIQWLSEKGDDGKENFIKIIQKKYYLSVHVFCLHSWGHALKLFHIQKHFEPVTGIADKIKWYCDFLPVQNKVASFDKMLNVAVPTAEKTPSIKAYLASLAATKHEKYAYRKPYIKEMFFSSPMNRIRYENILLSKGIELIANIQSVVKPNVRPLGFMNPDYKTFGLGTHFFTWRNIPNNCPLVFWWDVAGHDWRPLFPPRRGTNR